MYNPKMKLVKKISWEDSKVFINLTCDAIKVAGIQPGNAQSRV
jgi:hypothetical protein